MSIYSKLAVFIILFTFLVGCKAKSPTSSSSDDSSSSSSSTSTDTGTDSGGTSTTIMTSAPVMDGYYKITGIADSYYTYSIGSGTLYGLFVWQGNGTYRLTQSGSLQYSYGSQTWTIDCSTNQIVDIQLYSDGYVAGGTLIQDGCGSGDTSGMTVNYTKFAKSSVGITRTTNITYQGDTFNLYYYYTADSFDLEVTNKYYGKVVNQFYLVASTDTGGWGTDVLSYSLSYGESWTLWGIYPCGLVFDWKAVATDGTVWQDFNETATCWVETPWNLVSSARQTGRNNNMLDEGNKNNVGKELYVGKDLSINKTFSKKNSKGAKNVISQLFGL